MHQHIMQTLEMVAFKLNLILARYPKHIMFAIRFHNPAGYIVSANFDLYSDNYDFSYL